MKPLRNTRLLESGEGRVRRSPRSFAVSIAVHAIVIAALVRFLISPAAFSLIFGHAKSAEVPAERIGFLQLPRSKGPAVAGKSGGDNRPVSKTPPKQIVAPSAVPTAIPPVATPKSAAPEGGSGP